MQKKGIREYENNGICAPVKNPEVVSEYQLMKSDEESIPADGCQNPKNNRDCQTEYSANEQTESGTEPAGDEKAECADRCQDNRHVSKQIKDSFDFFKMDSPAFRHCKIRKLQRSFISDGIVINQHIVVPADQICRITGIFRNMQK